MTALQGQVMTVAAAIAFVVAVVGKATLWPYEIPTLLAWLTGDGGLGP